MSIGNATQAQLNKIIDFLETHTMSATFSSQGLNYFSLRGSKGELNIDLQLYPKQQNSLISLILQETLNFIETGKHNMPLDFSDFTTFQQQVFDTVSKLEPGKIITYKGLAEMLGKPGGAQAVGSAVAKNPVSYFLPTHRVLPQKGIGICRSGAGFLREKLLEHEGHDLSLLRGNYVCKREKCIEHI